MGRQIEPWVDEALRALGADDESVIVPARVEAAVMQAWDAQHAAVERRHVASGFPPSPKASARLAEARSAREGGSGTNTRRLAWRVALLVGAAAGVVVAAAWLQREPPSTPRDMVAPREFGFVLVPDPLADPTSLQVVRLRMRRAGLASLGVPLVNPDADGLVEVEVLVGEDGVARSIRRTALVTAAGMETGGQR